MCETLSGSSDGVWTKAIPLPLYLMFGFTECGECGVVLWGTKMYQRHYKKWHPCECGKYPFKKE